MSSPAAGRSCGRPAAELSSSYQGRAAAGVLKVAEPVTLGGTWHQRRKSCHPGDNIAALRAIHQAFDWRGLARAALTSTRVRVTALTVGRSFR